MVKFFKKEKKPKYMKLVSESSLKAEVIQKDGFINMHLLFSQQTMLPECTFYLMMTLQLLSNDKNQVEANDDVLHYMTNGLFCLANENKGIIDVKDFLDHYQITIDLLDTLYEIRKYEWKINKFKGKEPKYPKVKELHQVMEGLKEKGLIDEHGIPTLS